MHAKITLARMLARSAELSTAERRRRLNQLTVDIRRDYDNEIRDIRSEIAALAVTRTGAAWRTLRGLATRNPFSRSENLASIARLRVQLAERHAAKFTALTELKILKTLA